MKRRWFTALLGSAPVAMSANAGQQYDTVPSANVEPGSILLGSQAYTSPSPLELLKRKSRQKFWRAKEAVDASVHQRNQLMKMRDFEMNLNIQALRSVSMQHKAIMQMKCHAAQQEERKSLMAKIAEQFGFDLKELEDGEFGQSASH